MQTSDTESHKRRRPGYLSQYARHAGIALTSAAEALKRVGIDYMQPFDFHDADLKREAARHADRVPVAKQVYAVDAEVAKLSASDPGLAIGSFSAEQTRERHFRARLAELEFNERVGQLVYRGTVEAEWFRVGRIVRDALLNIPSRIAGILAAESDQRKVHDLLEREIRQALEVLSTQNISAPEQERTAT